MTARTSVSTPELAVLRQPTLAEIRNGLPASFLDHLKDTLEVTETQLAGVVGIARQTLVRRKSQGILRRDESDRAAMIAKVFNTALSYFDGNREHALEWLKHPSPALAGETPLQHADTVKFGGHGELFEGIVAAVHLNGVAGQGDRSWSCDAVAVEDSEVVDVEGQSEAL